MCVLNLLLAMDLDDGRLAKRRKTKLELEFEDDHRQTATGMETLPGEIVVDVLSRLPITSLVQFKFVCKGWRALAQDPVLAADMCRTRTGNTCLILHCDFPIKNHLYFVDLSPNNQEKDKVKRLYVPFQTSMPEFDVVGSCNGLLCLSDSLYNDALYVYNPFTMDYIELPKSRRYPDQEVVFGFGFHPKTEEYKVVMIVYYRNTSSSSSSSYSRARRVVYRHSDVQVFTLGSSAWRSLGKIPYQLVRRSSEALVSGRLHWVSRPRRYHPARCIMSFDIRTEEFEEVPKPDCGGLNRCNFHVSVLRGCLAAAVYGNYGKLEIWVMKDYNVKESWTKEFSIGAYMPKCLKQNLDQDNRPLKIWKNNSSGKLVRVLSVSENGEILLEYKNRVLVSYDPKKGKFTDLVFQGIPHWFQTVVHAASFSWINTLP
ncbi:F-box protein [Hibiscus syriacus]|uniref:F-box protein n=1 Tax=Hibiscus syriacus TaxID=106335 RepID=A0A6A3BZ55_HIBSY|nr:F-box protein At3g07870-like [Hibiscus syriacus]KAE8720282.1 F-box protein [Hibiscus syriacus]